MNNIGAVNPNPTTRMVSNEAATTTRAAVLALGRRMERFEGEARSSLTQADITRFRAEVVRPLEEARSLMGREGVSMTETEWRGCWNLIGASATAWETLRREWQSPTRIVSVPFRQAIEQAQQVYQAAAEVAPRLGLAMAGGMVIAALAGLWLLSEIFD